MDEPKACYTEWIEKEKNKSSYINTYLHRIRKLVCTDNFCAGRNGDSDIEKRFVDTVGEGESGMNEESINMYIPPCVKYITGKKSLYNTGTPAWRSVMT